MDEKGGMERERHEGGKEGVCGGNFVVSSWQAPQKIKTHTKALLTIKLALLRLGVIISLSLTI